MTQFTFELIFQYGAFPGVVIYFVYTIMKEHRNELKDIREKLNKNDEFQRQALNKQNESINEVVSILQSMNNTMANQMHSLLLKFIELSQKNGGEK